MQIHLSYVAAADRETGKVEILKSVGHLAAGGDTRKVVARYETFLSAERGADDRKKYSHVTFVVDNVVRATHEFPDPAAIERATEDHRAENARRIEGRLARIAERKASIEAEEKAELEKLKELEPESEAERQADDEAAAELAAKAAGGTVA